MTDEKIIKAIENDIAHTSEKVLVDNNGVTIGDVLNLINRQKAELEDMLGADVVKVVRCKDCKHLKIINDGKVYAKCEMTDFEFMPFGTDTRTHYCGFAEQKCDRGAREQWLQREKA